MHFSRAALSLAFLAASALAQTVIVLPTPGSTLAAGSEVTVQVGQYDTITSIDQVVLVIGLASCGTEGCPTPSESMGDVLYQGPFNPVVEYGGGPFYENFTVTVPESIPAGNASLNILNVYLVADANVPNIVYLDEIVTVVA